MKLHGLCSLFLVAALPAFAEINVDDLLEDGDSRTTQMVVFQQGASSGTDSTTIPKISLVYFTSADCTASAGTSVPSYTTPNGTSFTISVGAPFGMGAAAAWNVGYSKVSPAVADMTAIQSIAVTFKSTNSNTPQAAFTGKSFACVPVTCSGGECTSGSGTQSFTLKTTAAIGDPADGGIIACMNGGSNNLVVPSSDYRVAIAWGGNGTTTGATSTTDGSANTTTIVTAVGSGSTYAARACSINSAAGGYTSGWFLPAGNNTTASGQLNCLYTNKTAIGGFGSGSFWSSTESSSTFGRTQSFTSGVQSTLGKTSSARVRCARAFTP